MRNYYLPPEGFYIFGYEIKFYGLIMALSMLIGVVLACILAKKRGVKSDDIVMLAIIVLPCAVIGARLYFLLFYGESLLKFFNFRDGGLAIYGGVIGGLLGIIIFTLIKKDFKLLWTICDICVPCLILGQCLGRWGNFFNQEAYGNLITNPSEQWFPNAVFITAENGGGDQWYQATFFYESLWNFIGFIMLLVIFYKSKITSSTSACYLVWYGLGRAIIEGLRSDSLYIGSTGIRVSQLLSMVLVVIGLVMFGINIYRRIKKKNG